MLETAAFAVLACCTLVAGFFSVTSKHLVRSVLWLALLLGVLHAQASRVLGAQAAELAPMLREGFIAAFLLLLIASATMDWWLALRMADAAKGMRRPWLVLSLIANLGLLGFFKYADFGIRTINALGLYPGSTPIELLGIVLPVGISFYTFQTMSYTIDV